MHLLTAKYHHDHWICWVNEGKPCLTIQVNVCGHTGVLEYLPCHMRDRPHNKAWQVWQTTDGNMQTADCNPDLYVGRCRAMHKAHSAADTFFMKMTNCLQWQGILRNHLTTIIRSLKTCLFNQDVCGFTYIMKLHTSRYVPCASPRWITGPVMVRKPFSIINASWPWPLTPQSIGHIFDSWGACVWSFMIIGGLQS